ncbi:MAG: sensor histidine kinase [Microthrixaceae bacterium]
MLVTAGPQLDAAATELLDALCRTVAVAVTAASLQRDVAAADAVARADAVRRGILQAVSHDLRTPLAGIKASVTSLLSPDVSFGPEDTAAFLTTIDHEVDRLDRVVGNLLDMSRLQAGELSVHLRPTALEEVVAAAMDGLDPGRELRVELDVDDSLPLVSVDPALLERAIANVTANALAVQPPGVAVRLDARSVGDRVHLRVVDRGPGIAPEQRDQVFAPFQRLGDRSTQAGVGLGLAIAQGFTRAIGGELDLDDTPGGGLTVTFRLPGVEERADGGVISGPAPRAEVGP